MPRLLQIWVLSAAGLIVGCAEELPGAAPPSDQLHYPMGMIALGDTLVVVNSNFDQLYNAGSVTTLSLTAIDQAVTPALVPGAPPIVQTELPGLTGFKKIGSFGGGLVALPSAAPTLKGDGRIYVAQRGSNTITMLELTDGTLGCGAPAAEVSATDCSPGHSVSTNGEDPFALALIPSGPRGPAVVVSHLFSNEAPLSTISIIDTSTFDDRVAREARGESLADPPLTSTAAPALFGATGVVFTATAGLESGRLILAGSDGAATLGPVASMAIVPGEGGYVVSDFRALSLGAVARASGLRGVVASADGRRVYASLRFRQASTTASNTNPTVFNSAVGVLSLDRGELRLVGLVAVGQELGRPSLLERRGPGSQRLLYVGDVRTSQIWILDVSTDAPLVLSAIEPLTTAPLRRELIASPFEIYFPPPSASGHQLGLVTSFGNSTLAVIDVSDVDPSRHRIVARLGQAKSRDGVEDAP